jgi:hypothetical protein
MGARAIRILVGSVLGAIAYILHNAPLGRNLHRITCQIQGKLKVLYTHANPELNSKFHFDKCAETRWYAPTFSGRWYSPTLAERQDYRMIMSLGYS